MPDQLSIRLPRELAQRLAQRARAAGVKRSQIVRAALAAYFDDAAVAPPGARARSVQERISPYIGALRLDRAASERDALARRLRAHNWRE